MRNRKPTHPGEVLREDVLPAINVSITKFAEDTGISRQTIHRILACTQPITTETALRIGKYVGNGPEVWVNMQTAYDLWEAIQELAPEIENIPKYNAA